MATRKDWAIIMARGDSSRMGEPKGLCSLSGDQLNFLQRIIALYQQVGFGVAAVTTEQLQPVYAAATGDFVPDRWIVSSAGDGTARTVCLALSDLSATATHLWLHPVDLPSVSIHTISELLVHSRELPGAVFVPEYAGTPGHPVVLPVAPFHDLVAQRLTGAMRTVLLERCHADIPEATQLYPVPLQDEGVVADYDDPGSLE